VIAQRLRAMPGDELEAQFLQAQLERGHQVLYNLQQQAAQGQRDPQLQTQIDYQQGQIDQLSRRLIQLTGGMR
jgi:hypothetical protein